VPWTYERADETAAFIRQRTGRTPDVAVVLGSGLGEFAERLSDAEVIPYADLPHWPPSHVVGHPGRLVIGTVAGTRVAALAGRSHYYEGHDLGTVTFPIRVIGRLGIRQLILTNAAGGVNTAFERGALMVIDDHINLTGTNPLVGPNDDRFGPRFPDMTEVYSARLRKMADAAATARGIDVVHGVYLANSGPSYETPAEIRMYRTLGADAIGMSTVVEAIVARHMGIEVLGISCITNVAAGILAQPIDHADVLETTRQVRDVFAGLIEGIIERL
jgi:purine-nucleoside phosphorylase